MAFILVLATLLLAQTDTTPETGAATPAPEEKAPESVVQQQTNDWTPPTAGKDGYTWVQLKSREWLKGEIKDLNDGKLLFDSDKLNEFSYDWEDVRSLITSDPYTIVTWEHGVHTGFIVARGGKISVVDREGKLVQLIDPNDVQSMIQGQRRERNYWSGLIGIGSTLRAGNSDQTDGSLSLALNRRALITRWDNTLDASYSETNGTKIQESQRFTSQLDWFLSRGLYLTPLDYEFFRDPFQNIAQRNILGSGFGYDVANGSTEWTVSAGAAWQSLNYVSVEPGKDRLVIDWIARFGSDFSRDLTNDIDFDLSYSINFPLQNFVQYSSNLVSSLSVDLWWQSEIDLSLSWDRQNSPQPAADGSLPKKDDLRLTTGISLEF